MFDRFFRTVLSRTRGGAALGLAICSEIVAAHEGRIDVTSEEGRGTTFTFWIPVRENLDVHGKEDGGVASTAPTGATYSSPSN